MPNRLIAIILLLTVACSSGPGKEQGKPLARVYGDYLFESELSGVVPPKTSRRDSIQIVKNFISNWIEDRLVYHKAKQNLTADQQDFAKQLEDYRNSLTIYAYETKLVSQKLNTKVTDDEISNYYEANKSNFELKDNIVKVMFVKLKKGAPNIPMVRNWLKSDNAQDRVRLASYCSQSAVNFFLDDQVWLVFSDLLKEIPIQTYNEEAYLQNHRFVELTDSLYQYLVAVKDFKIKESVSPLSFEKENIRNILINKRKLDLIRNMQQEVYKEAVKRGDLEVF